MARQPIHSPSPFRISQAPSLHNTFLRGLITEVTEVGFPENAVTETFDCIFSPVGFVSRRLGFDYESGFSTALAVPQITNEAVTEFVWNSVAGDGTISFLVQQVGFVIYFYDLSTQVTPSANRKKFTINLVNYVPAGSGRSPTPFPCQYASGRGILVIVNRVTKPIYVVYSPSADNITVTPYEIQTRDFTGLADGLTVNQRPTVTTTTLKGTNPNHYYNLLNQGWGEVGRAALTAWDSARSGSQHDSPSNADYVLLYRASPTSIFDNNRVLNQDPLTSPAAKGHYILNACNPNRNAAMAAEGFSDVNIINPAVLIGQGVGNIISSGYLNQGLAFDGVINVTQASNNYASNNTGAFGTGFIGKNYTTPQQIQEAVVYGTNDHGFINNSSLGSEPGVSFFLQASQSYPISPTDGINIGFTQINNAPNETGGIAIQSNDANTLWNYVWVYLISASGSPVFMVSELQFYNPGANTGITIPNTTERPTTVSFFAGRLFYAGINALQLNNTLFFTQILLTEAQYGQCYQVNDPTNETVFALLPSDGGTIAIPEIGSIRKLFTYQNALLIFASNGVWMLTGGSSGGFGGGFTANDFFVKKLSSVGMNAPLSIVDRRGVPMWIGEDGVYMIEYNAQFNSFNVINMTFKTIKSFFLNNIPHINHQYVKGAYDPVFDVVYWLYNTTASPLVSYSYSNVLLHNGIISAFYPWTIQTINPNDPQVRGVVAVADAARNNLTRIKFFTSQNTAGSETLLYSEQINTGYQDWITAGLNYNYSSYLKTSYKLDTQGQRYVQLGYVWVYLEHQAGASMFVQGLFDFANSTNSGKWSQLQQAYNQSPFVTNNFAVDVKRLKLRGKGRSIQLQFLSDTNKPFQVQGWAIHDTMTMGV